MSGSTSAVWVAALLGLPLLAGCGTPEGNAAAGEGEGGTIARSTPELVVFVYDRSSSIEDHQLKLARDLTNDRIRKLDHGDRIAAHELLQLSLDEPPKRWSETVPKRQWTEQAMTRDSVIRARFLRDAQDYLVVFTDTTGRAEIDGTDILSTMHDVAADLRAAPNRQAVLYVFSDMLQSNRTIDMEGLRRMPPASWVADQVSKGTLPDLTGLCVVVIGARVDTEASQRVKSFWDEYFEATGANLTERNYTLRPVTLPEHPCD
ncbi:MAG: hypothetical protein M8835_04310 [marine benthic group bacterium]|jgi:hypothetical protein|nr:hypothetical protein [Gemmatimonadota bacterium]MCL7964235.1 hypothetical protein [Gemmatimonadota bacterium]MCL7967324.1 hypothetical protein [Gemmatimonadota bacterium]MCL7969606.1 hypothetical protein [Gemmatimonadota bacterium]MCL7973763.1 hypothetical protein [Gemmatimonadota bacterium]